MPKFIIALLSLVSFSASAAFIHPMDFNGSDAQKSEVIQYIQAKVKDDYCNGMVDMCNATTLRMMENENLKAFKQLTRAKNRSVMDRVIRDYCNSMVNMCSYQNILLMYEQNLQASQQELSW